MSFVMGLEEIFLEYCKNSQEEPREIDRMDPQINAGNFKLIS